MTGAAWGCPAGPRRVGSPPAAGASAPCTPSRHRAAPPSPPLGGGPSLGAAGRAAYSPARPAGSGWGGSRTLPRTVRSSQRAAPAGRAACGPCGARCRPRGVSVRGGAWLTAGLPRGSAEAAASQASRAARRASRWAASSGSCLRTHTAGQERSAWRAISPPAWGQHVCLPSRPLEHTSGERVRGSGGHARKKQGL